MLDTSRLGRWLPGSLTVAIVGALAVPLMGVAPAAAVGVNEPPVLPHSVIVFPVRDFVSVAGLTAGQNYVIEDWRAGVKVGASSPIPVDRTSGLVEVNHPGGGCWVGVTPDVRTGDRIVVHPEADAATGDATTTADVTVTQPATEVDAATHTVTVRGTAADATGAPLPIGAIEARLVANKQAFVASGKRTLRAPGDGTISYDAPGSINWTATFPNLSGVSAVDGIADWDRATNLSESRGMWLGTNPATLAESTIYEYGQVGGPAAPCTAPLATGPSTPDMTATTDTGTSNADNVTGNPSPSFSGVLGNTAATSVNLYVDGVVNGSSTTFGPGGSFTVTPATPLVDGAHAVRASEVVKGIEILSAGALPITVDQVAPAAPNVTGTAPAATGNTTAPGVQGTAEAGSTVTIFGDAACTAPTAGTGSAAQFGSTGVTATTPTGATSTFFAQATDLAGNVSGCSTSSATYVQDSVPPANPTIDSGPRGLVSTSSATFSFSDSEGGVTFRCALDGAAFTTCASPKLYSAALAQGAHSFAVVAVDPAGNLSDPASASWTVDTVAPTSTITSPVGATINDPSPVFHFSASEPGSTFTCSLDGAPSAACADGQSYGTLADGAHRLSVSATDTAGNTGSATAYTFTVDTAVPDIGINSTPPNPTNVNTPTFTYASSKPGVSYTCVFVLSSSVNPVFSACPGGSYTSAAKADGTYTFTVKATDTAGNVGSASTLLTIDTTPPAAPVITGKPAASSSVTTPSFAFTSEAGASFQCSLTPPGGALVACATGETYGPLTSGTYTFKVVAKDAAGNVGPPTNYSFTVDVTAPSLTVDTGPAGLTSLRAPSFGFSSTDTTATFQCALAPTIASFSSCTTPKSYTALADGSYTFQVQGLDAAGNVSSPVSRSFTVDGTAPILTLVTTPTNPTRDASPVFSFSTSETSSAVCSLVLSGAADSFSACTSPKSYTGLANGSYRFAVKATDAAGNTSAVTSYPFVLDTVAPVVTLTSRPTNPTTNPNVSFVFSTEAGARTLCSLEVSTATANFTACTSPANYAALAGGTYTFAVEASDAAGNTSASVTYTFTVSTATDPVPTVTARTPAINAAGFGQTANLTATFSEAVTGVGSATFTLRTGTTTTTGTAVTATSVTYNATTRVATFDPSTTLAADTKYTASLTSEIKDSAGQSLAPVSWTFTTGPRPTVTAKSPASGAIGVARAANVTATFSENVTGISGTTFLLKTAAGASVTTAVSYNATTHVATLNPGATSTTFTLAANTKYTASLTTAVKDAAGNPIAATSWSFTTGA